MKSDFNKLILRLLEAHEEAATAILADGVPNFEREADVVTARAAVMSGGSAPGARFASESPREVYFARWVASRPCECAPGKPPCFPCGARAVVRETP